MMKGFYTVVVPTSTLWNGMRLISVNLEIFRVQICKFKKVLSGNSRTEVGKVIDFLKVIIKFSSVRCFLSQLE